MALRHQPVVSGIGVAVDVKPFCWSVTSFRPFLENCERRKQLQNIRILAPFAF